MRLDAGIASGAQVSAVAPIPEPQPIRDRLWGEREPKLGIA